MKSAAQQIADSFTKEVTTAVKEATAFERERCAKIAERSHDCKCTGHAVHTGIKCSGCIANEVAAEIATEIRKNPS